MDVGGSDLDSGTLLAIIKAQTAIAKLGLDLGAMLSLVADEMQTLTHATGAIVELAEGDEMVYRAAAGMAATQLGLRLKRQGSLSGLCVASGEILQCRDTESDPRVDVEACRKVGIRSMVVAPLAYNKTPFGALKIASREPNAFQARDVRVLELMTDLIGAEIYQASDFNELYHRATHDGLTGISNRALFYDRLRQGLLLTARRSGCLGVLNLDMDDLKPINDQYGHRAGDAAIRETAQRIKRACRESDTVARLGGDEFGVILSEIKDREGAELQAARIAAEIEAPFWFEGHPLPLKASLGIAVYPEDGADANLLMEKADQAMYAVKRARKRDLEAAHHAR
ncbi:MAG TPA: sensor domain-containing diguanylate cyclase [Candidatus Cybelea sp.]|nr:sensor domain-containing diguanylate cyclase [Candidatus Cybelea sp.]